MSALLQNPTPYCGRFAPSPTGPLHFGSLVAALGSALEARVNDGVWLLRVEDVDVPRTIPGAADEILRTLEAFGFEWSGEVLWQSHRLEAYAEALSHLVESGAAYPCSCSRKDILDTVPRLAVDGGQVYPGTCRKGLAAGASPRAWRLRVDNRRMCFEDQVQGTQCQHLETDVGDPVLKRADGYIAYQLAVVVDDAMQGVTHVVRGADLLDSTPRQIWLQQCLGVSTPEYAHLPVVVNAVGEKLSKQTRARALLPERASTDLCRALEFLGQGPPPELFQATISEVWAWARLHWRLADVPRVRAAPVHSEPSAPAL